MKEKDIFKTPKVKKSGHWKFIVIFIGALLAIATTILCIVYWNALISIFEEGTWIIILLVLGIICIVALVFFIVAKIDQHNRGDF